MRKKIVILAVLTFVLVGATILSLQKQNIFSNAPQQRKQLNAKEKQLAYLKEHDNEIKEFVKSQTQRSNLFRLDWDQDSVGKT